MLIRVSWRSPGEEATGGNGRVGRPGLKTGQRGGGHSCWGPGARESGCTRFVPEGVEESGLVAQPMAGGGVVPSALGDRVLRLKGPSEFPGRMFAR